MDNLWKIILIRCQWTHSESSKFPRVNCIFQYLQIVAYITLPWSELLMLMFLNSVSSIFEPSISKEQIVYYKARGESDTLNDKLGAMGSEAKRRKASQTSHSTSRLPCLLSYSYFLCFFYITKTTKSELLCNK